MFYRIPPHDGGIPLILAAVSALLFTRRRAVYALGPSGAWLAPAFLWSLWYAFLWLGHLAGSLAGAGTIAALPLAASAYWAIRKTRPRRIYSRGLTAPDWTATTLIAACLIAQPTFNFETHIPLIETYLRGNVPPCDYNDPAAPLNYHALYSASAALFAKAFGFSADFASTRFPAPSVPLGSWAFTPPGGLFSKPSGPARRPACFSFSDLDRFT